MPLSFLVFLCGNLPIALQGGTVNNFFVGRHLFPHRELRKGKDFVLVGNVLDPVIVLDKLTAIVQHIAARGKVAVLFKSNIPPVSLLVKIIQQLLWHVNGLHVLHIDAAQGFIVLNAGIKLVAIQVLRQIDKIGHAGSMFAAVNDGLKFL